MAKFVIYDPKAQPEPELVFDLRKDGNKIVLYSEIKGTSVKADILYICPASKKYKRIPDPNRTLKDFLNYDDKNLVAEYN